ncbi:MAG TPA: hypothetical protein VFS43_24245 [Polyangiaceae bacterium]|nr:hypothetical protein [Polyangiaceae bacterium]
MPAEPTPEEVRAFWAFLTAHYGTTVVDKADAAEMALVAAFLDRLGVMDRARFLANYTTTIGRRIYLPFELGKGQDLWHQMVIAVHEHQHVVQLDRDGWLAFTGGYLLRTATRARYETEAYRTHLELHFWRTGAMLSARDLAAKLRAYGCSGEDVVVAEKVLRLSEPAVRQGAALVPATRVALSWLNAHAPHLRASSTAGGAT